MKKITLFAAAVTLLLSGGVFMKTYQVYDIDIDALIESVTAGADPGLTTGGDTEPVYGGQVDGYVLWHNCHNLVHNGEPKETCVGHEGTCKLKIFND